MHVLDNALISLSGLVPLLREREATGLAPHHIEAVDRTLNTIQVAIDGLKELLGGSESAEEALLDRQLAEMGGVGPQLMKRIKKGMYSHRTSIKRWRNERSISWTVFSSAVMGADRSLEAKRFIIDAARAAGVKK